jgi:hypothetical protein
MNINDLIDIATRLPHPAWAPSCCALLLSAPIDEGSSTGLIQRRESMAEVPVDFFENPPERQSLLERFVS